MLQETKIKSKLLAPLIVGAIIVCIIAALTVYETGYTNDGTKSVTALILPVILLVALLACLPITLITISRITRPLQLFKGISDAAYDPIIMMDSDAKISYWNKEAETVFGYSKEEVLGKDLHKLLAPEKYQLLFREHFPTFQKTGTGAIMERIRELEAIKKDGTLFPIELSVSALKFRNKWNAIGIARDITRRKELEDFKNNLTNTIVHDLKNPLTVIMGAADILGLKDVSSKPKNQKELIDIIHFSSKKLHNLILDLLQVEEMKEKKLQLDQSIFKAEELIDSLSWLTYGYHRENRSINFDFDRDLILEADKNLLLRILENLLSNAMKHSRKDESVTLVIKREKDRELFEVIDNGDGIPKKYLGRIFDRFFKVQYSDTKSAINTGMGLTFCKMAVELQGGEIGVESEIGKGSKFYFYLPRTV
jgi:PAS domain S-box-containing protein